MKVCKKNHAPIVFSENDTDDGKCPLCDETAYSKTCDEVIIGMHETALKREDYIAKIEVANTRLRENIKLAEFDIAPFKYETITWEDAPIVKPKRSHKKKEK